MTNSPAQPSRPPAADEDLTGRTIGRFRIHTRLGMGGMGEVYAAEDTVLKRTVALKRMNVRLRDHETSRRRFLKEAERASKLNDPHIASLYDVLEQEGELFLVMEYVEGHTLRQATNHSLSVEQFLDLALQCAQALTAAHERGILHRDLKPENIMLTPAGRVKVLDFGVARELLRGDDTPTATSYSTHSGSLSGTLAYMAPESLLQRESDGRADLFSLGVVFYEMLTGRHPFRAEGLISTTDRILHSAPHPLAEARPDVPAELQRVLAKLLEKKPEDRYATAADLLVDLRALTRVSSRQLRVTIPLRKRKWLGRRTAVFAAAGALLVALALAVPAIRQPVRRALGLEPGPLVPRTLVVLPCRAEPADAAARASCQGMTEMLTKRLHEWSRERAIVVVPQREVRERRISTPAEARIELGAQVALETRWRQAAGRVAIECALVDTSDGRMLGSTALRLEEFDSAALEGDFIESVAQMLEIRLTPGERRSLARRDTQVPQAREFYLRGRGNYLLEYDSPANLDLAIKMFQQALELDPQYVQAHAGLGQAFLAKYRQDQNPQWVESARRACDTARALAPTLAEARVCLGQLYNQTGEYERAATEFHSALESEPDDDGALRGLASAYEALNNWTEAERAYRRAIDLRREYWGGYSHLGAFYFRQGRYEDAAREFAQVVALAPNVLRGHTNLAAMYTYLGRYDQAIPVFKRSLEIRPSPIAYSNLAAAYFYLRQFDQYARYGEEAVKMDERYMFGWGNLGEAYYLLPGQRERMTQALRRAIALGEAQILVNPRDARLLRAMAGYHALLEEKRPARQYLQSALALGPQDPEVLYKAAFVSVLEGNADAAMDWVAKAVAAGYPAHFIRDNAFFDRLRSHPRYAEVIPDARPAAAKPKAPRS